MGLNKGCRPILINAGAKAQATSLCRRIQHKCQRFAFTCSGPFEKPLSSQGFFSLRNSRKNSGTVPRSAKAQPLTHPHQRNARRVVDVCATRRYIFHSAKSDSRLSYNYRLIIIEARAFRDDEVAGAAFAFGVSLNVGIVGGDFVDNTAVGGV